jgi:hypothetical protein
MLFDEEYFYLLTVRKLFKLQSRIQLIYAVKRIKLSNTRHRN